MQRPNRGYFGIGVEHIKNELNIGTLWRSANILGASFIFTVGKRYKRQSSDTMETWRHIPLYHYNSIDDFYQTALPYDCLLIGVELDERAVPVSEFQHPTRAIYLLGAEDSGLTEATMKRCHRLVVLPGDYSMNVAVAGSIIMFDRLMKSEVKKLAKV